MPQSVDTKNASEMSPLYYKSKQNHLENKCAQAKLVS